MLFSASLACGRLGPRAWLIAAAAFCSACSTPTRRDAVPVVPSIIAPAGPSRPASPPPPPTAIVSSPVVPARGGAADASQTTAAPESPAVAARFPEPAMRYQTPAFEPGRTGFSSNAEVRAAMSALVRGAQGGRDGSAADATTVRLVQAGSSQTGIPLEALHFSRPVAENQVADGASRPTVLLVAQQHGDEPAGSEALLVIAQQLARGSLAPLLDRIDVVILPRANPDGASAGRRFTASGIDVNRDHLLLRTPEAQAQAQLVREFNPAVVVDSHEFWVPGPYLEKFGAVERYDALIQYAMVANLSDFVTRAAEEWFRRPLLQSLKAQGLSSEWYHTTSADLADKTVSMGSPRPETSRNVNGLRHAVSLLIETRGAGLGRAHLGRRVHTQVTAIESVLKTAAARADDLQKLRRYVDQEITAKACRGDAVVEAEGTPSEYTLAMLDPQTGADKSVDVAWISSLALAPLKQRPRPCGYWLGADQTDAVLRLRALGLQVQQLDEPGALRGEVYAATSRELSAAAEGAGMADAGGVLRVKVDRLPMLLDVRAGSYYIGLDQPLANLAIAALEPDTESSFLAHRVVTDLAAQARVLQRPETRMSPVP